jgi:hypothetical protein
MVFNTIPVGVGLNWRHLEQNAARIRYITGDMTLREGISIITDYPENFPRPRSNQVLFTACSHSGIINIVDRAMEKIAESGSKKKLKKVFKVLTDRLEDKVKSMNTDDVFVI